MPKAWAALDTTTMDDIIARGRAKVLFGFDNEWEVYKPEHQRKFGYYALPIGSRLCSI
jgi:uncharacterized protein YcaQ